MPIDPITLALKAAGPIAGTIASAIPGKMESMYRKDIISDRARLASGHGGMAAGQRGQLQSEALNQIQAQQNAQMANLARGSASGQGASGLQQQQIAATQQAAQNAGNQAMSNIRQQDLALAEAQRQQLYARMAQARAWGQQRKQEALAYANSMGGYSGDGGRQGIADTLNKTSP